MQSKRFSPFVGALFVLLIILLLVISSHTFQSCIYDPQNYYKPDDSIHAIIQQFLSYRHCAGVYLTRNNPAITAISTGIISIFTITLWLTSKRQASLIEETLVADKRAFVFAPSFNQVWSRDSNGLYNWQFRPVLRNSGETPTKGMRMYVNCEILDQPLPRGYKFVPIEANISTGTIAPKFELQGGIAPVGRFISPQDIVDCQSNRRFIYLWGWIEYNDVFPKTARHITKYCWAIHVTGDPYGYIPNTQGAPPTPGALHFSFRHHFGGNCIDEECSN